MQRKNINSQILIDVKYISLACEDYLIYTGWMGGCFTTTTKTECLPDNI